MVRKVTFSRTIPKKRIGVNWLDIFLYKFSPYYYMFTAVQEFVLEKHFSS